MNYAALVTMSTVTETGSNIVSAAGDSISAAWEFLIQPGNFSIAIGIALIYLIVALVVKGAGKLLSILTSGALLTAALYFAMNALGLRIELPEMLSQLNQWLSGIAEVIKP